MPRNSGGTYTLPAGNPVVTGTTISSTWANTTLADLSTAMTDSLSRSGQGGMSAPLALADGTAPLPALTFVLDPDTGLYRPGANIIGLTVNGAELARVTTTGIFVGGTGGGNTDSLIQVQGTNFPRIAFLKNATATYYLGGDTTTSNDFNLYVNATNIFRITSTPQFGMADGTIGNPAFSFFNDLDTGIYRPGANALDVTLGGVASLQIRSGTTAFVDGNIGSPGIQFINDPDTGIYRQAVNAFSLISGGVENFRVGVGFNYSPVQLITGDGNAGTPIYSFNSDPDTGFYRDTANQIAIALGGVTAGQIAQGTFTVTYVGGTTAPTGLAEYQRIGNHVVIYLPNLSATSNSTGFSLTGFPAIVQCPSGSGDIPCGFMTNNGAPSNQVTVEFAAASGTLTILIGGNPSAWTAAGTKSTSSVGNVISYRVR